MLINSVIIKLIRKGMGVNPDYSLIIYGHGSLEYYGNENVKVKGKIEETLEKEKIINLLSEFKKSGFFSLNDTYSVDESSGQSFTTISISVPGKDGILKTKTITHYQDDRNVPVELINLEEKIDEITGSEKWIVMPLEVITEPSPPPQIETQKNERKVQKSEKPKGKKTFSLKMIIGIVAVIIVLLLIVFAMTSGIFDSSNDNTNEGESGPVAVISFESLGSIDPLTVSFTGSSKYFSGNVVLYNWDFGDETTSTEPNPTHTYSRPGSYTAVLTIIDENLVTRNCSETILVDYFPPYFTFLTPTTASVRIDGNRSIEVTEFQQGEIVYIDYEFNNVTHNISNNISYDFTVEISVKSEGVEYDHYSKPHKNNSYTGGGLFYVITDFQTSTNWPTGDYEVVIKISDSISKKNTTTQTSFKLNEMASKILKLTTASNVRAYQDYDSATQFEQFDPVFIYTEYAGIHAFNENTTCDIQLKIDVTYNGVEYYANTVNKTEVGNMAQSWWFTADESWPTDVLYTINLFLQDASSDKSATAQFDFSLIEKDPKILLLTTATDVRAYQDYDASSQFNINDTIYIYLEYDDINTTNDNTNCDITLKVNVTFNGVGYYSNIENKNMVGNNAHTWWFTTDETWLDSESYQVKVELIDNATGKTVIEQTDFSLD